MAHVHCLPTLGMSQGHVSYTTVTPHKTVACVWCVGQVGWAILDDNYTNPVSTSRAQLQRETKTQTIHSCVDRIAGCGDFAKTWAYDGNRTCVGLEGLQASAKESLLEEKELRPLPSHDYVAEGSGVDKKLSTTLTRHINASKCLDEVEQLKAEAKKMGHSLAMHIKYMKE